MQTPSSGSVPFGQSAESSGSDAAEGAGVGLAPTRTAGEEPASATASAASSAARIPAFTSGDTFYTTSL
jgi:hypothetical protein